MGGGPKHISNIFSLNNKFNFYIAAPSFGFFSEEFKKKSVFSFDLPYRKFSFIKLLQLLFFIKKNKIELIHSHGRGAGLYSRISGLILRIPVIHSHHGIFLNNKYSVKLYEHIMNKITYLHIFVSESEFNNYNNNLFYKISNFEIIPNGVNMPSSPLRQDYKGVFNIITVTRLEYEKGNDILIKIMSLLVENDNKFRLTIVGDGPLRDSLEKLASSLNISSYVTFLGVQQDVSSLLLNSDVFISCSRGEAQGIAILEAMSFGIPVIASNVPGHIDTIKSGFNGLLFNLDNIDSVIGLINLLSNKDYYDFISSNSKSTISSNFLLNHMIDKIDKVYSNFGALRL